METQLCTAFLLPQQVQGKAVALARNTTKNQRALAEPCQRLCSERWRPFVSLQRDLCVGSLEWELFPLATSHLTIGRKPAARFLRVSTRKLTGLVGRKREFFFNLGKSHASPSGNVEIAAWANLTLVGPKSIQNIPLSLALLGRVRCWNKENVWQDEGFLLKGGFASAG